jgi:hypothetical protein
MDRRNENGYSNAHRVVTKQPDSVLGTVGSYQVTAKRLEGILVDILNGTNLVSPATAEAVDSPTSFATRWGALTTGHNTFLSVAG